MTARRVAGATVVLAVVVLAVLGLVRAAVPEGRPSLHEQVDAVAATLRCPTCQGLSIADSTSVLAGGSRAVIEQQLREGRTPDQIRQYFVDRYGDYVLLDPAPSGPGLLVWLLPALVIAGGALMVWRWLRRSRAPAVEAAVDPAARSALAEYRAGRLVPDGSPAGEALREALLARESAEEDDPAGAAALARADERLAAAVRRYAIRGSSVRARTPARALPRRAVTVGAAAVLLVAAGVGVGTALRDRGGRDPVSGDPPGQAAAQPASDESELEAATEQRPEDPAAWLALARAQDRAGRFDAAVAAYDRALALEPGADDVVLLRANVLVRAGRAAEALPAMQQLAARYPDDPDVLLVLGLAQEGTGAPEAVATLRRFLELAPDSPAAPGVRSLLEGR